MNKYLYLVFAIFILVVSCEIPQDSKTSRLVKEWIGKEILYPDNMILTSWGRDTISRNLPKSLYSIVVYADSIGCMSCKLHLSKWKSFINELDSIVSDKVLVKFIMYPKDLKEIIRLLRLNDFKYPVCIDLNDTFNRTNGLPKDEKYHTFLLDNSDKVLAVGNPILNVKVKELYMNIIKGDFMASNKKMDTKTDISIECTSVFLGKFEWQYDQKVIFLLKNTGSNPLVIDNVATSCGCTSVDYSKEPVRPGDSVSLHVTYKADHPEHFDKTITVYCNAKSSPITLRITGDAE